MVALQAQANAAINLICDWIHRSARDASGGVRTGDGPKLFSASLTIAASSSGRK